MLDGFLLYKFSSDREPGKDSVEGGAGVPLVQQFAAQSLLIKEAHIGMAVTMLFYYFAHK